MPRQQLYSVPRALADAPGARAVHAAERPLGRGLQRLSNRQRVALAAEAHSDALPGPPDDVPIASPGSGRMLPGDLRLRMERSLGHDFGQVRVHEGAEAERVGALAYTRGNHIHFRPGHFDPYSPRGRQVLGHELAHVVQQREGRVSRPAGPGAPINADTHLEREADALGHRAARGLPALSAKRGSALAPLAQPANGGNALAASGASAPLQLTAFEVPIRFRGDGKPHSLKQSIDIANMSAEQLDWLEEHKTLAADVQEEVRERRAALTGASADDSGAAAVADSGDSDMKAPDLQMKALLAKIAARKGRGDSRYSTKFKPRRTRGQRVLAAALNQSGSSAMVSPLSMLAPSSVPARQDAADPSAPPRRHSSLPRARAVSSSGVSAQFRAPRPLSSKRKAAVMSATPTSAARRNVSSSSPSSSSSAVGRVRKRSLTASAHDSDAKQVERRPDRVVHDHAAFPGRGNLALRRKNALTYLETIKHVSGVDKLIKSLREEENDAYAWGYVFQAERTRVHQDHLHSVEHNIRAHIGENRYPDIVLKNADDGMGALVEVKNWTGFSDWGESRQEAALTQLHSQLKSYLKMRLPVTLEWKGIVPRAVLEKLAPLKKRGLRIHSIG